MVGPKWDSATAGLLAAVMTLVWACSPNADGTAIPIQDTEANRALCTSYVRVIDLNLDRMQLYANLPLG